MAGGAPPVVTGAQAAAYRGRILAALPEGMTFEPLMTLYLTEQTDPDDLAAAHASGLITSVKLYPAGATTNSASGVKDFDKVVEGCPVPVVMVILCLGVFARTTLISPPFVRNLLSSSMTILDAPISACPPKTLNVPSH